MKIIDNKKGIKKVWFTNSYPVEVGKEGVRKIVPYEENGEHAKITWFNVFLENSDCIQSFPLRDVKLIDYYPAI